MSTKRILPALILAGSAGMLGAHRFYAGRIITGLLQFVLFAVGAVMVVREFSGVWSVQTPEQLQDWIFSHQNEVTPLPVLLVAIPSFWALGDCVLLAMRRFKDGAGEKMTRWV